MTCTNSCSLTPIHRGIQQCLFPLTCSQKVCSISLLLSRSLWIMYVTGVCGNPWISAYQCKPSSHSLPLLNIRVFPALMGTHLTSVGVLTGRNIVCPVWKVNAMAQLSSALLHWLRLSPHLSVPLTMTLFPCFNDWVVFHHEPEFHSLIHSSLLTVHFLYIHLWALGMLWQCMLSCLWFSKSVYFWSILGVERPSHTAPFVSVKSHGQWVLYWLFPLICPH